MKKLLACTALLAFAGTPARATVTYNFVTTWVSPSLPRAETGVPIAVVVSDTVYLRGSVSLRRDGCPGTFEACTVAVGPWDRVGVGDVTPDWGSGAIDLTFLPDGTLAGSIVEDGRDQNLTLSGSGLDWSSSRYSSDRYGSGDPYDGCGPNTALDRGCAFTGYFFSTGPFPIPEPAGAALLGTGVLGLMGLALARRRTPG